jgi:hypothetical protein
VPCIGPEIEGFHFGFNNRLRQRFSAYCKNTNRRPDNYSNVITKQVKVYFYYICLFIYLFSMAQQPLLGQGLLIIEASRLHSDTPHSVRLLRTSDQFVAETST